MPLRDRPAEPAITMTSHFNTKCVKVSSYEWCFHTEGFAWKWQDRGHGSPGDRTFNTGLLQPEGDYSFQLYSATLSDAVRYAWGFASGWKARKQTYENETKPPTKVE